MVRRSRRSSKRGGAGTFLGDLARKLKFAGTTQPDPKDTLEQLNHKWHIVKDRLSHPDLAPPSSTHPETTKQLIEEALAKKGFGPPTLKPGWTEHDDDPDGNDPISYSNGTRTIYGYAEAYENKPIGPAPPTLLNPEGQEFVREPVDSKVLAGLAQFKSPRGRGRRRKTRGRRHPRRKTSRRKQ